MVKGELRLFAVKRYSTDQILFVAGRSKFEVCEALASEFPDEYADDFEFLQENALEVVTGGFGGVAVLADTTE